MKTLNVESTTLTRVGYDASAKLLCLEFRDRTTYQYFGVPAEVHASLMGAPSKGQYFNRAIRGRYDYAGMPKKLIRDSSRA